MAYDPSPLSSSTIWLDCCGFDFVCCSGGTWTSNALRERGCVIMKMISSTSSTSISGVTLMSELRPSPPPVGPIAMGSAPRFLFHERRFLLGDGADHPYTRLPGDLDGLLDAPKRDVLVRLQEQDLVRGTTFVERLEPPGKLFVGDRLRPSAKVEEELLVLIDPEPDLVRPFGPVLGVVGARDGRLEALRDQRRDDHEDDQQHQHHVDQRRDVDVGLDGRAGASG